MMARKVIGGLLAYNEHCTCVIYKSLPGWVLVIMYGPALAQSSLSWKRTAAFVTKLSRKWIEEQTMKVSYGKFLI